MRIGTRDIGVVGTVVRAGLGTTLLVLGITIGPTWWDLAAAAVGYPVLAVGSAAALSRVLTTRFVRQGRLGVTANIAACASLATGVVVLAAGIGLTFVTPVDGTSLYLFLGGSMLLSAAMGYAGCEVLALPNLLLRRRDTVGCVLFTALDRAERGRHTTAMSLPPR